MRWPGQIYDGEAARKTYTEQVRATAKQLGIKLDLRSEPIYSGAQADAWLAEAQQTPPDGLLVMLLDRQEHAWPTANKAVDTKIPTVVFAPLGAAFTTNTVTLSHKTGCLISCTNDFRQVEYGMKMLHAGTKMHATRMPGNRGQETACGRDSRCWRETPIHPRRRLLGTLSKDSG